MQNGGRREELRAGGSRGGKEGKGGDPGFLQARGLGRPVRGCSRAAGRLEMGLCCLCYNFLLWEEMEGARVGLLRGGAGSRVAGECTGKGFIGHRCTDPSNAPFHCPSPAGHHHLFFWGLYHGRCQTGPRLSGLTGLGNSGHWFVGSPCHWPLFLGLGVGPETQTSWVLRVEKTRGPCLSVKDTGWNEDAPPRPRLKGLPTASGKVKAVHQGP